MANRQHGARRALRLTAAAVGVLVVRIEEADIEACSDWLWQLGATAIEERNTDSERTLVAGFPDDGLALVARSVLSERWACRLESTGDEAEWRDEWMKWIEPIEVAGFVVHAPWHDPAAWADWGDLVELSVDPGRAFGSGHHPTTQLTLAALRSVVKRGDDVLDVGCGTGILSLAAAKLGARAVLGIDLDFDIIEVAAANIEANGAAQSVEVRTDAVQDLRGGFDVVVANIVIGDLAPIMAPIVDRADSFIVISGFLDDQFERLLLDVDVKVVKRTKLDDWGCSILTPTK